MLDRPAESIQAVTAVIPNWNRRDLLERLLPRLKEQTCPAAEVIVVDNGSSDGSPETARKLGARAIELPRNYGFSAAVNRGIEEARTELIAVINNDVEPEAGWLEALVEAVRQPRVWFATGKLLDAERPALLDGAFDAFCRGGCAWRAGQGRPDGLLWAKRRRIRLAPFTAALFRAELFRRVGKLDERFGSYLEDVDFCLRAALAGFSGLYVPEAVARHRGSATLGTWHKDTVRNIARNQVLLIAKHYPVRYLFRYGWSIAVAQLLWGGLAVRHGRGLSFARGKLEGITKFWRVRRGRGRDETWKRGLSRILEESESDIYYFQKRAGFDLYWRLYFALTSLT